MNSLNDALKEEANNLLKFDAIDAAEKITGDDYCDSQDTASLGMILMTSASQRKRAVFDLLSDTHFNINYGDFQKIAILAGFKIVLQENIPNPEQKDVFQIWWNDKGILMKSESYYLGKSEDVESRINSATIYYNWKPNADLLNPHRFVSSGSFDEHNEGMVLSGYHDVREGMKIKIGGLEQNGTFLKQWIRSPSVWLINYMESRGCMKKSRNGFDYQVINARRISLLPQHIQEAIRGEKLY